MAETATITCPRDLATAALAERQDLLLRLWLVARHLDAAGAGHVALPAVVAFYEQQGIGSARHVAAQVERGAALGWWSLSRDGGTLYLSSTARAFAAVGADCVSTVAVEIPLSVFSSLEAYRANLYASYFVGRRSGIFSRAHLVKVFKHTDRTLIRWQQVARVQVESCIATATIHADRALPWSIGEPDDYQTFYQCRRCHFKTRHAGAMAWHYEHAHNNCARALPAQAWAARRLPNSYSTSLTRVRMGCLRVIRGGHLARSSAHSCSLPIGNNGQGTGPARPVAGEQGQRRVFVVIEPAGGAGEFQRQKGLLRAARAAARHAQAGESVFLESGRHDGARMFAWCGA